MTYLICAALFFFHGVAAALVTYRGLKGISGKPARLDSYSAFSGAPRTELENDIHTTKLLGIATTFGALLPVFVLLAAHEDTDGETMPMIILVVVAGGFIIESIAFRQLMDRVAQIRAAVADLNTNSEQSIAAANTSYR